MIRHVIISSILIAGCSNADFGGGSQNPSADAKCAKSDPTCKTKSGGSTGGGTTGGTTGPTGSTGSTGGLTPDNGGNTELVDAKISVNSAFDGVTVLTIDLQTGNVTYNNPGKYALAQITLDSQTKGGDVIKTVIPLGGSAKIPNWRPAKSASPHGFDVYERIGGAKGNPPAVSRTLSGTTLKITINDDLGTRPGAVTFPNFDLGLVY